ncbi:MAG: lipid-A-disaccharide synthase [Opitutales bacterium]|nr:lipid-A-disaccharide synthase [Opitutales bacterium]
MPTLPEAFPPPVLPADKKRPDLLIIAGEHSGDELAATMIGKLRSRRPELSIAGFGGPDMQAAGAQLLFNMTTFSAVGLVEVLANISFYTQLGNKIIAWIERYRPRAICFVDFPGMNLRLAEILKRRGLSRKGGGDITLYHYVSPQIWAWKAKRRFKMQKLLDSLGVIFPFEVKCYEDTTLPTCFVGDPFAAPDHVLPVVYDAGGPALLLPGSRPKPVSKIFPILLKAWELFLKTHPTRRAVVLHPGEPVLTILKNLLAGTPAAVRESISLVPVDSVAETQQPASSVLMSSGTMSRTCSLAGVPGAILYYANPLTWILGRLIVGKRIRYLGIANILLDRDVYPEYLQKAAEPVALAARLNACYDDPKVLEQIQKDCADLRELLSPKAGDLDAAAWLESALC